LREIEIVENKHQINKNIELNLHFKNFYLMLNFDHYNPTQIVFGKNSIQRLPELLALYGAPKKVMLIYGQGSIHKNGIYDKVMSCLSGIEVIEFSGIEANPEYETCLKAALLAKSEKVDFLLAVGGGSVIDATKFIANAALYEGNSWNALLKKSGETFTKALPIGTVLTIPATGSEANTGSVINRSELKEKRAFGGVLNFPKFSILDPTVVSSLPKRQIANGIIDAFTHTTEQYITYPTGNFLQERQAEAILSTLIEIGPKVIAHPENYELASNLMWCATHALNGNLRLGVPADWSSHMIGHELTAMLGIDHAVTLAIVGPRLWENQFENKKEKLAQYGRRVWNLVGSEDEVAQQAIEKTELFFQSLGVDNRLTSFITETSLSVAKIAETVEKRFIERSWLGIGEKQAITPAIAKEIILACS
jgi:NADP-dependent alcohol dehydrogenase